MCAARGRLERWVRVPEASPQRVFADLARRRLRQLIDDDEPLRKLLSRQADPFENPAHLLQLQRAARREHCFM
jgi:hypothetical protein